MKQATLNKSNVTGFGARSSFEVQREAGDCQREALTLEYTIVSSLLHVVCLSMLLVLCHFKITTIDRPWYPEKPSVSVWLLVRSSEVGVPFHYALVPLKTDTRQKIRGDRSCTHVPT